MNPSKCARILAVLPTPSYSHQSVFAVYLQALASRNHEIVAVRPVLSRGQWHGTHTNITDVDVSLSIVYFDNLVKESTVFRKRGVVADDSTVTADNYMGLAHMIRDQFDLPGVKTLIAARPKFDVLVAEAFMDYPLVFSHLFGDIPIIQISSGHGVAENFETQGAVSRHPIYYPNMWRTRFGSRLSPWQTIQEIYTELRLQTEFETLAERQTEMMRLQFGADTPTVHELRQRVELLFLNVHPLFDNNRPVPSSVQYLGGLHLQSVEPDERFRYTPKRILVAKIREIMDNSERGVVYASFGSGIVTSTIEREFLDMLLDAFASLPYTIMWKFDGTIEWRAVPRNVYIQHWFEQYQLLQHRNVKAFLTQGGVQSTDEAIECLVPLVGLPMMGDQAFNVNKYAELKIGRALDTLVVDKHQLSEAITDVITNPIYRKNLAKLRHTIRHPAVSPVHKAIWYTEHVIAGNNMLKTPAANVTYSTYAMSQLLLPFIIHTIVNHLKQLLLGINVY